jgi:hypothetical protein
MVTSEMMPIRRRARKSQRSKSRPRDACLPRPCFAGHVAAGPEMVPFVYTGLPIRVVFGSGTLEHLGRELTTLGRCRALVLSTPAQEQQANAIAGQLGSSSVGVFAGAVMHTPVEVTERALQTVAASGADALVSVGGGSTIGLGKALALRTRLPQIVVPTTYAGSEVTPILGETVGGRKTTIRDPNLLPKVVLYDVDLTLTLPGPLSMTSGINAMAHAAEALYAINGNPVVSTLAEMGIASLAARYRVSGRNPPTRLPAPTRCLAHGPAASVWEASTWRSITSFATPWAGRSIFRIRRRIRCFFHIRSPTTRHRLRSRSSGFHVP